MRQETLQANKGEVLIVEDTAASLKLLSDLLTGAGYHVRQAPNGELALWTAQSRPPELILLDVRMPGMDGYEVCRRLKQMPALAEVPVIFLSAQHDTDDKLRGFALGGVDFIAKPFQAEEILARADAQVRLRRAQQALAAERASLEQRVLQRTAELAAEVERRRANEEALRLALTERKAEQHLIDFLSYHDALTGLPNRAQARERFEDMLAECGEGRRAGGCVSVLSLDLDRFKSINDSCGPAIGDEALRAVARYLRACVREGDMVSRHGGDEFLILLPDDAQCSATTATAQAILAGLRRELQIEGHAVALTTSIGIAVAPADGATLDELARHAEMALFRAKELGRDGYAFFTEGMDAAIRHRLALQSQLRGAVARNEFSVHYQPQVDFQTGRMTGAEALVRWHNAALGQVPPSQFIPVAEEYGLINAIGVWVLDTVCAQIRAWQDEGLGAVRVAVNLSGSQFAHADTVPQVAETLRRHGVPPSCLGIEITEGSVMGDPDKAVASLRGLKAIGVGISLDDFGTGYSSLAYLKRFPIDVLKIDKSFVDDVAHAASDAAIALSVISLAHNLNMRVVAEGVETPEQARFLASHGCDAMQGYLYSRPLAAPDFTTLLRYPRPLQLNQE